MPGVFDEGDGDIAKGWRELGANPSSSDLFVGVVASPENACVEGKCHDRMVMSEVWIVCCVGCFRWSLPMCEW